MNVVMLGPPGSGKGTQAKLLQNILGLDILSVGYLLRELSKNGDRYNLRNKLLRGEIVDDRLTTSIIMDNAYLLGNNTILDGYPRSMEQAVFLHNKFTFDTVISIHVPYDILKERLILRMREDDTVAIIERRLDVFYTNFQKIRQFYQSMHDRNEIRFANINGNQDPGKVFKDILGYI